jgi:hypothetical protein
MVRQSIPDAWALADPPEIVAARQAGAAAALRRISPDVDRIAESVVPTLDRVIAGASGSGRALFSANRDLHGAGDPVESLWQACTCLREHRGDGHVAALTAAGLSGCEALVLFAASEQLSAELFLRSRGWTEGDWEGSLRSLEARGLLVGTEPSPSGWALREWIEGVTDDLAASPLAVLDVEELVALTGSLRALADEILGAGVIPFPNPIARTRPDRDGGPGLIAPERRTAPRSGQGQVKVRSGQVRSGLVWSRSDRIRSDRSRLR